MKKEITFLIGLPGSGKSYWFKKLIEKKENNVDNNYAIFDDISQTDPTLKNLEKALLCNNISEIYIADVNFLKENVIESAIEKIQKIINKGNIDEQLIPTEIIIKKIIFIGNEEICKNNVSLRKDGRNVIGTINRFKHCVEKIINKYENSEDTTFLKVLDYSQNKNLFRIK